MSEPLAAFQVGPVIGRGATAHVRKGVHRTSGEAVAIKLFDRGRHKPEAFEQELRVQASMVHPDVLMVLDGGLLQQSLTGILAGTPYLILEWASGGAADSHVFETWTSVRRVLETCLSGLARAHAAGVVHRDVKLGNVLRCTAADRRPGYKLADFGIATLAGSSTNRAGTPASMAPEQIEGRAHEIGPATDLYALGCMAFRMVTGRPPVLTTTLDTALMAHLTGDTVAFEPQLDVPRGLEAWIRRLRAVDPYDRPAHAAEALDALRRLEGLSSSFHVPQEAAGSLPRPLAAAGRRLAGLRLPPTLGRGGSLARLRSHLEGMDDGEVRLAWVRGPAGVGRSHLLRSFAVEVQVQGRADVIDLEQDWLRAWLGTRPTSGAEEHLTRRFPEATSAQIEDLAWLWATPWTRLPANALRRVAEIRGRRPLVVLVDDAPRQVHALAQVVALFNPRPECGPGVLVVASVADEQSRGAWRALPKVGYVVLEPLPTTILETMVVEQLGLSVREASAAVAGAGGLPREAMAAALPRTGPPSLALWTPPDHPSVQSLLAVASVLSAGGPVAVDAWLELAEELVPEGLDVLPDLVDALLDGGVATSLGSALRIEPAVLPLPVDPSVRDVVVSRLSVTAAVRARALHRDPEGAVRAAVAHVVEVGADPEPVLLDGLARAVEGEETDDWRLIGRFVLARLYTTLGDSEAVEEVLSRCSGAETSSLGRLRLAQRRMHLDLFAGRYDAVESTFEAHREELAAHPEEAAMSWLLLALVPRPSVAGRPVHEAGLMAEELASRAGQRTLKVEARRLLGELAHAEGRLEAAKEWLAGARSAARRRFCLPLLGVVLAEARFALAAGELQSCRQFLDELDGYDVHGSRPAVLSVLQRAELAVVEEDWFTVAVACDRALRMARDLDWTMVQWAAEALRAGVQGEARRWDAAERAVEGAVTLVQHEVPMETVGRSVAHLADVAERHGQVGLATRARVAATRHGWS